MIDKKDLKELMREATFFLLIILIIVIAYTNDIKAYKEDLKNCETELEMNSFTYYADYQEKVENQKERYADNLGNSQEALNNFIKNSS